ncbi:HAD-IA family hydrolase [Winogradskyella ursingii]|uniref:HAD-IA family hydrolase n=1 Tax=Winogradskyella ursingii TaxID=2686079 RepID=UPI0015CDB431|nr:HAD-IA family hydrolase [Winogradskyella ursingii]
MIKTLIFDFGDVFINLDKQGAMSNALNLFNIETFENDMLTANINYEIGKISTSEFIDFYLTKFPDLNASKIKEAWNYLIKDFPQYRLEFVKSLARDGKYQLILLSNTNAMHIDFIKSKVAFYEEFKSCFDVFYLSQEINLRKANANVFKFLLKENNLNANECLFIDDTKENTDTAEKMGFHVWNIDETSEDVVDLLSIKKDIL